MKNSYLYSALTRMLNTSSKPHYFRVFISLIALSYLSACSPADSFAVQAKTLASAEAIDNATNTAEPSNKAIESNKETQQATQSTTATTDATTKGTEADKQKNLKDKAAEKAPTYQTIEWVDLIPQSDLDALMNPPVYLDQIMDGSEEDMLASDMRAFDEGDKSLSAYERALMSTNTKAEYHLQKVRIPGFVVPLEYNDQQVLTSFFIVPFFGACIHQPPPPPNQIIYAVYERGLKLESLYETFWIEGTLSTNITENSVATSAYAIAVDNISIYDEWVEIPE